MDGSRATSSDSERESIADEVLSISTDTSVAHDEVRDFKKPKASRFDFFSGIELPNLAFPPSQYDGWNRRFIRRTKKRQWGVYLSPQRGHQNMPILISSRSIWTSLSSTGIAVLRSFLTKWHRYMKLL